MKIHGNPILATIDSIQNTRGAQGAPKTSGSQAPSDSSVVRMSHEAGTLIENLQSQALEPDTIRADKVAEARQQLADGTLTRNIDFNQVIDSLLADL